jgi:hypothetical protein
VAESKGGEEREEQEKKREREREGFGSNWAVPLGLRAYGGVGGLWGP